MPIDLQKMLDRPIAFQRAFVYFGAGITGALMLSQAVYWSNRTSDEGGWFYKTQDEWEEETGLTRREQETARTRLAQLGLLEEIRKSVPAKLFYRVNSVALNALLETIFAQSSMSDSAILDWRKAPYWNGGKRQSTNKTETTTETTTDKPASFDAMRTLKDMGVEENVAKDWLTVRKAKRAANTMTAFDGVKAQAQKAGLTMNAAILLCVENSWQGFKAEWLKPKDSRFPGKPAGKDARYVN